MGIPASDTCPGSAERCVPHLRLPCFPLGPNAGSWVVLEDVGLLELCHERRDVVLPATIPLRRAPPEGRGIGFPAPSGVHPNRAAGWNMTEDELKNLVLTNLVGDEPLASIVTSLSQFRDAGGLQADAVAALEELRAQLPDREEDIVLEALDFASGWCSPRNRIWT
jgi:hypothetical protein